MEMKPFTRFDWDAFAGATMGPLGQTPAIGEIPLAEGSFPDAFDDVALVLVDGSGVQIHMAGGDSWYDLKVTFAAGLAIAAALVEPLQAEQLTALGFTYSG